MVGTGPGPKWVLREAGLGLYEATVVARWPGGRQRRCTLHVRVVPPGGTMSGGLPARSFLVRRAPERQGYGLYSYLLLGSAPNAATLPRYRRAVEEFVRLVPALTAYADVSDRRDLNIDYLPVDTLPPSDGTDAVLAHYDYARAQVLLAVLPGSHLRGPYLVSARQPLSGASRPSRYMVQDLSAVPDTLVGVWVREFLGQATQEKVDANHSLRGFALRLRTLIGAVALGLPEVTQSMNEWKDTWAKLVSTKDGT